MGKGKSNGSSKNYDIDGIHFDDYFYYESYIGELDDNNTFNKYNSG